jgi:dihydrolipoamide dehydrogenase
VIIGGGAIGVEFAYILHSYGVRVEILEFTDRVLPNEDADVRRELQRHYRRRGSRFTHPPGWTKSSTTASTSSSATPALTERPKRRKPRAFICIGFCPNVENRSRRRWSACRRHWRYRHRRLHTHVRAAIYAIGDATAKVQLAHVASAQGVIAAETIAGVETMPLDYRMMPRVTFCQPQVASFGYTEEQARAAGHRLRVATFPMQASAKARAAATRAARAEGRKVEARVRRNGT